MRRAAIAAAAAFATACASSGGDRAAPARTAAPVAADDPIGFTSRIDRDHPLVGVIWDVAAQRRADWGSVRARMASARHVLLGEKHDDPDHHALQARALRALVASGRRPAVAFEMLEDREQAAVDAYMTSHADARDLGTAVAWDRSGWPPWDQYRPIADVAMAARLPIVAANLSRAQVRAAMTTGVDALPPAIAARVARPLAEDQATALKEELAASHCGHLPAEMVDKMVLAQRARDAALAERMRESAARADGSVLIAGAGHVRNDRGVPTYLDGASVSIAFIEVERGANAPADYAVALHAARLPFDYVVFTPRANDDDPCARFAPASAGASGGPRPAGPRPGPALQGPAPEGPGSVKP